MAVILSTFYPDRQQPSRRGSVHGVGVNDVEHVTEWVIEGQRYCCPFYSTWREMLKRCYSRRYQETRPQYKGCTVCEGWLRLSWFESWMSYHDWEGKELDKDILGDGKLYSSGNCCFVPHWLNTLFKGTYKNASGPKGIWQAQNGKYRVHAPLSPGKQRTVGYFDSVEEAMVARWEAQREYILGRVKDYPDRKIRDAVIRRVQTL